MQQCERIDLSIIIVNYNTKELLVQCLDSIFKHNKLADTTEIIVVDNASGDGSVDAVKNKFQGVLLVENTKNTGFSCANNMGTRIANGRYLLLLNSDAIILPDSIERLVQFLDDHPDIAIVGPKLLNTDMTLQRSWFNFPSPFKTLCHILEVSKIIYKLVNYEASIPSFAKRKLPAFMMRNIDEPIKVDYLLLACLMIRRNTFDKIGLLDENLFFYHEDCDLGYRAKTNKMSIFYYPNAQVIHVGGSSSSKFKLPAYRSYFKSLIYVVSKNENIFMAYTMRLFIVIGMLTRAVLCFIGFYRDINKIGIYKSADISGKYERPGFFEILSCYFMIAVDCLRLKS